MTEDTHYQILKILEQSPQISQRELAKEMGVSLGKVNYCLKALIGKGYVKAKGFRNSHNKAAYFYLLTRKGFRAKTAISLRYLHRRMAEYEGIRVEIAALKAELSDERPDFS